ncbi:hypothetical protein HDV00_004096 [Rhizophlyctis rosea]|nr:hypothetical protein HDV00_004096 [Rhizophlyctis rosea]
MTKAPELCELKATDLLKREVERQKFRRKNYEKEYQKCLDTVKTADSSSHEKFVIYSVPDSLNYDDNYVLSECVEFMQRKLRESEFYVRLMRPGDKLFISWDAKLILKGAHQKGDGATKSGGHMTNKKGHEESNDITEGIYFNASSALSTLHMASSLMLDNPKYAHLQSVRKMKQQKRP